MTDTCFDHQTSRLLECLIYRNNIIRGLVTLQHMPGARGRHHCDGKLTQMTVTACMQYSYPPLILGQSVIGVGLGSGVGTNRFIVLIFLQLALIPGRQALGTPRFACCAADLHSFSVYPCPGPESTAIDPVAVLKTISVNNFTVT